MVDPKINQKIKKFGYVSFNAKRESPSFYQLDDGSMLRVYPILNSIISPDNKTIMEINMKNVIAAYVPKKLRGAPATKTVSVKQSVKNHDDDDVDFNVISEPFNEYVLDSRQIMKLRTHLTHVIRSKERNATGEPIYIVNTSFSVKLKNRK